MIGSANGSSVLLDAGGGDDSIAGGSGADLLYGNTGADSLDGAAGNDTLIGGDGDDTLTGGAGNDTFTFYDGFGNDTITDFDIGDDDSDGFYNDQLDVSGLTDANGGPVQPWDVVVSDDGFGNALLTFPNGETLVMQGVAPSQMSSSAQMRSAGMPCFVTGTRIATPGGERAVEDLRPGDLALTHDGIAQPVLWHGRRKLSHDAIRGAPALRPVRLSAGLTGTGRSMLVSPQHGIAVRLGGTVRLARAIQLARMEGGGARQVIPSRPVAYHHILLPRHAAVISEGIATESFYPGPRGVAGLSPLSRAALGVVVPDLAARGANAAYGGPAFPYAKARDLPRHTRSLDLVRPEPGLAMLNCDTGPDEAYRATAA
ncbi:Hint domain-containing protein [Palleronia pelagia]|uniref:Hemolysin-type calcium-binding repeat-containing protein n=1 Tax=Palleronia pelagia TaxID=387096 RepID=A0A1H8HBY7_9RHOB|nr:Hint domain-containing protein [Palleronia pelagia]SEN53367.1 Hemolysin-type calcium-binding repeat-containing protein [Palleronia pelagia]